MPPCQVAAAYALGVDGPCAVEHLKAHCPVVAHDAYVTRFLPARPSPASLSPAPGQTPRRMHPAGLSGIAARQEYERQLKWRTEKRGRSEDDEEENEDDISKADGPFAIKSPRLARELESWADLETPQRRREARCPMLPAARMAMPPLLQCPGHLAPALLQPRPALRCVRKAVTVGVAAALRAGQGGEALQSG